MSTWPDNDPTSIRLLWFIAAVAMVQDRRWREVPECLFNVARRRPARTWHTGAKLYSIEDR